MKSIHKTLFCDILQKASISPRKRAHFNLHETLDDPFHRLLIAVEPDSYIRPHRHSEPHKWECFLIFKGSAAMLTFSEDGTVLERVELGGGGPTYGVEIAPGVWHTLVATSAGTVLMELKPGPYRALAEEDFASWAPAEGSSERAGEFVRWFRGAGVGSGPFVGGK